MTMNIITQSQTNQPSSQPGWLQPRRAARGRVVPAPAARRCPGQTQTHPLDCVPARDRDEPAVVVARPPVDGGCVVVLELDHAAAGTMVVDVDTSRYRGGFSLRNTV